MANKAYALAREELVKTLIAYEGYTTAAGAVGGTSLIDAKLIGVNDFISAKAVLIMDGVCEGEDKAASSFAAGTGTITVAAFSAQIVAGVHFRVLNISSVELDVVTLLTRVTALRMAELDAANLPADIDLIKGYTDTLEAAIGAIEGATSLHNKLTAARALLLDRLALLAAGGAGELTPARAGYLEELAAANIPIDIDGLKTSRDRQLFSMDFWSNPQEEVSVPAVAGTLTLPSVTVADLPAGATIVRAIAIFKARITENTNAAANKLNGATVAGTSQVIQIQDSALSGWVDAINFVDDQFGIAATTREGSDVLMGSIDIAGAGKVDANDTYSVRWLLALADLASLNFNDCACGVRIWYSV